MGNASGGEPIGQGEQLPRHCAKGFELSDSFRLRACRVGNHATGSHSLLMDIQRCTMGKDHVYGLSPLDVRLAGYPKVARLPCVLDFLGEDGDSAWCRQVSRSSFVTGSGAPTLKRPHSQPHKCILPVFPCTGWRYPFSCVVVSRGT